MASAIEFIISMFTEGTSALDDAGNLFRAVDNELTQDAIASIDLGNKALNTLPGVNNPLKGLKNFIRSSDITAEWEWFKRVIVDMFLIILVSIGTLILLYVLA